MGRLNFHPYTQVRRPNCTSVPQRKLPSSFRLTLLYLRLDHHLSGLNKIVQFCIYYSSTNHSQKSECTLPSQSETGILNRLVMQLSKDNVSHGLLSLCRIFIEKWKSSGWSKRYDFTILLISLDRVSRRVE